MRRTLQSLVARFAPGDEAFLYDAASRGQGRVGSQSTYRAIRLFKSQGRQPTYVPWFLTLRVLLDSCWTLPKMEGNDFEGTDLVIHTSNPIGPVSGREFTMLEVRADLDDAHIRRYSFSVDVLAQYPVRSGYVRGFVYPQGVHMDRQPDGSWDCVSVTHMVVNGWVPTSVVMAGFPETIAQSVRRWVGLMLAECSAVQEPVELLGPN